MSWFITALVAISLFLIYNIVMISLFGIPYSLSGTYYLLNQKLKGSGVIFSVSLILVLLILLGPWMYLSLHINQLGIYLVELPCLSSVFIMISAHYPNIRDSKTIERIHTICALIGAILATLWICIVCWKIMYVIPIWILLCGSLAHSTKTAKSSRDFWIEWCVFGSTFTAIITEYILLLY